MKVLLHICCANCACYVVEHLRGLGHEVRGLFFNPNIQPFQEHLRRSEATKQLGQHKDLPVIFLEDYALEEFFRRVVFRESQRCWICYQWRMETTARIARRGNYDAFTTTLLFSKHQQHEMIRQVAEQEAGTRGVRFLYEDFRSGWKQGIAHSMDLGLYRQTYCGCIYSEKERYGPKRQKQKS